MAAVPDRSDVTILPAGPDDAAAIRHLPLQPATARLLNGELVRTDRWVWVARTAAGEVVGMAMLAMLADEAHLLDVVVAPDHRRRGIGAALVQTLRELAATRLGATGMTLEVRRSNQPALALYRHLGFTPAGVRPDYYPDGGVDGAREDAVVMWDHGLTYSARSE